MFFFFWGLTLVIARWGQRLWVEIRAQDYTELWHGRGLAEGRTTVFPLLPSMSPSLVPSQIDKRKEL